MFFRPFALLFVAAAAATAQTPRHFSDESLAALRKQGMPLVEAKAGARFKKAPTVRRATRKELEQVLIREMGAQMQSLFADAPKEKVLALVRKQAPQMARERFAKYVAASHEILLFPENFSA